MPIPIHEVVWSRDDGVPWDITGVLYDSTRQPLEGGLESVDVVVEDFPSTRQVQHAIAGKVASDEIDVVRDLEP